MSLGSLRSSERWISAVLAVAGVGHDRRQAGDPAGWRMAIDWAIIPPIDMPTTWARSMPSAVEQPGGVVGHVVDRVSRDVAPGRVETATDEGAERADDHHLAAGRRRWSGIFRWTARCRGCRSG